MGTGVATLLLFLNTKGKRTTWPHLCPWSKISKALILPDGKKAPNATHYPLTKMQSEKTKRKSGNFNHIQE